ncbi:MAG: hypothetical protein DI586_00585 [Micavibrio aeruginosavorus]|uniref:Ancillary SecYEG translocon subunit/Cell division coordinator CpoB TPR domain-containing protein n=1 Tax=Micavibrio aeruginosavorus TaxID=349221 RepID=A0A2W5FN78_9BACT|nr:MAG: hypothetical protein DI586_00585 [Micavibrio aeruginosavorus]
MADLLREVDEAIRADNMKRLWDEHKTAIVTGITALILGTAAFASWNSWQHSQNQKNTDAVITAMQTDKPAETLVAAAEQQSGTSRVVAYLNAAALELKSGNKDKALAAYTAAQETKSANKDLKDLATLQKTNLTLDLQPDVKADDLLKDLKTISDNKKSPWAGEALFMSAFLKGEKKNDFSAAIADLKTISGRDDVTESIKQRSAALLSVYELKLQEQK